MASPSPPNSPRLSSVGARARVGSFSREESVRGYIGYGADHPRKYVKGPLRNAYKRDRPSTPDCEYVNTCKWLGATPNSVIEKRLETTLLPIPKSKLLGDMHITLRDTYLGERGFIALMPLLDLNTKWTSLDASSNGLRNEAVLHLVDLLLQPAHCNRPISLDLSKNPISETAARALMELVRLHPGVHQIGLKMTKVPRRTVVRLQDMIDARPTPPEKLRPEGSPIPPIDEEAAPPALEDTLGDVEVAAAHEPASPADDPATAVDDASSPAAAEATEDQRPIPRPPDCPPPQGGAPRRPPSKIAAMPAAGATPGLPAGASDGSGTNSNPSDSASQAG